MSTAAGMPAVVVGEGRRRDMPDADVRPNIVVITPPVRSGLAGLLQRLEPVLVEALVAGPAAQALDVAVLHGLARHDEQMPDVMLDRLGDEGSRLVNPGLLSVLAAAG